MSEQQVKQLAKTFIEEQKRILEEYGDGVVRSEYNDAVASAQRTFAAITAKPKPSK
jgi:hypothetical protein